MPKRKWTPEEIAEERKRSKSRYNDPQHEWRESDRVGTILTEDEVLGLPLSETVGELWPTGTMFRDKDGTVWEWLPIC